MSSPNLFALGLTLFTLALGCSENPSGEDHTNTNREMLERFARCPMDGGFLCKRMYRNWMENNEATFKPEDWVNLSVDLVRVESDHFQPGERSYDHVKFEYFFSGIFGRAIKSTSREAVAFALLPLLKEPEPTKGTAASHLSLYWGPVQSDKILKPILKENLESPPQYLVDFMYWSNPLKAFRTFADLYELDSEERKRTEQAYKTIHQNTIDLRRRDDAISQSELSDETIDHINALSEDPRWYVRMMLVGIEKQIPGILSNEVSQRLLNDQKEEVRIMLREVKKGKAIASSQPEGP